MPYSSSLENNTAAKADPKVIITQKFKCHVSIHTKKNRIFQTLQHSKTLVVVLPLFSDPTVCDDVDQLEAAQNC